MLYNSIPSSKSVLISALIWATGLLWNRGLKPERDTQLPGAPSGCGTSTLLLPRPCHGPCGVSPDSPKATAASLGLVLAWQCKGRKKQISIWWRLSLTLCSPAENQRLLMKEPFALCSATLGKTTAHLLHLCSQDCLNAPEKEKVAPLAGNFTWCQYQTFQKHSLEAKSLWSSSKSWLKLYK